MTVGLITRDASGNITANMTKRMVQIEGSVTTNKKDGAIGISLPPGREYFYTVVALENSQKSQGKLPGVTITQNRLEWAYRIPSGFIINAEIFYGYY